MTYHEYLESEDWQMLRQIVIDKQDGQCALCGKDITEVHHITYPITWAEDSPDNLIGLCGACHLKEHKIVNDVKTIKYASIWDYVLVKSTGKSNPIKPENIMQCKYEEKHICKRTGRNDYECEFFNGTTHVYTDDNNANFVICSCHNMYDDEDEDEEDY